MDNNEQIVQSLDRYVNSGNLDEIENDNKLKVVCKGIRKEDLANFLKGRNVSSLVEFVGNQKKNLYGHGRK